MTNRIDDLLEALADSDRRLLLDELDDGPRTVDQLAATLAASTDTDDEEAAHVELHHVHLPVLRECGLVDVNGNCVTLQGTGGALGDDADGDAVPRHV